MVLSNKKLKQKLRSIVAESLTATESGGPPSDAAGGGGAEELQCLKQLLCSKSQQPSFSKKVKKRKRPSISDGSKPTGETEAPPKENGDVKEEESKKRKREDGDEGKTKAKKSNKKKKDRKRKKTWWEAIKERKKKKREKAGIDAAKKEIVAGENNGTVVAEPLSTDQSEQNAKKVYVGGIPYYSSEDDIRSFFEGCGTVTEVDCMTFPESGKFRGIAILTFKTEAAVKRALALDGSDMGGFYLKIQPYKGSRTHKSDFAPEIVEGYNRAYVGNLPWDITEEDLQQFFSDCDISSIRFGMDKETGDFKGFAHVDFSNSVSLKNALKFDQEVVCGRQVRIRCAVSKKSAGTSSSTNSSVIKVPKKSGETSLSTNPSVTEVSKKSVKTSLSINPSVSKAEDDTSAGKSKKNKRRTCYECGVPGHLSSSCPQKATSVVGCGGNS